MVCDISCKLGVGAKMVPIEKVATAVEFDEVNIESDGRVILLDFWATWCPPCQAPMKHNDDMLKNHPEWEGKARIIGLSIDQDQDKVMPHVKKHGYERVEHFVKAASDCDETYGVNGVPHCVLIDKEGVIQFVGHPSSTNLEKDIQTLIDGGKLSHAAGGEEGKEEEKKGESLDSAVVAEHRLRIVNAIKEKQASLKPADGTMMRDAVVVVV